MRNEISIDEKFIINIFNKYATAKLILAKESSTCTSNYLQENARHYGIDQVKNFKKQIQIVDTILALLPKNEYIMIIKTFLFKNNKNWWKKFYQKNEYRKLYNRAINRFLYLYLV